MVISLGLLIRRSHLLLDVQSCCPDVKQEHGQYVGPQDHMDFSMGIWGRPGRKHRVLEKKSQGSFWPGGHHHMTQILGGNCSPVLLCNQYAQHSLNFVVEGNTSPRLRTTSELCPRMEWVSGGQSFLWLFDGHIGMFDGHIG